MSGRRLDAWNGSGFAARPETSRIGNNTAVVLRIPWSRRLVLPKSPLGTHDRQITGGGAVRCLGCLEGVVIAWVVNIQRTMSRALCIHLRGHSSRSMAPFPSDVSSKSHLGASDSPFSHCASGVVYCVCYTLAGQRTGRASPPFLGWEGGGVTFSLRGHKNASARRSERELPSII